MGDPVTPLMLAVPLTATALVVGTHLTLDSPTRPFRPTVTGSDPCWAQPATANATTKTGTNRGITSEDGRFCLDSTTRTA